MHKLKYRLICRIGLPLWVSALLLGCASGTNPMSEALSALAAQAFASGDTAVLGAKLNPQYRYLRVEVVGHAAALMVLGYIDPHPLGDIEVWYSGNGEVIRTQNGRIVATSGLPIDWRAVRFASNPPPWSAVPAEGAFYQRSRDEMPLHRYAISERLKLARLADQPTAVQVAPLPLAQARAATWFREDTLSSTAEPVPSALFAWGNYAGQGAVVYSYQCLSATFCLKLMPWPVQEVAP